MEGLQRPCGLELGWRDVQLRVALCHGIDCAVEHDATLLDEQHIGEDVFYFLDLMRGHQDGALLVHVIAQQRVVEATAGEQVQAQRRFIEH